MSSSCKALVRYEENGVVFHGDLLSTSDSGEFQVQKLHGSLWEGLERSSEEPVRVSKLLCPLESVPIIICVGLNYCQHADEANLTVPSFPVIFTKPADALAGPQSAVHVHPSAQNMLDYEGELVVIIGKDAKNVPEDDALDYVVGYAAGNDVSARNFQLPEASGGQYCYAKSFDGFAPVGPAVWSKEAVPDPQKLVFRTKVNGEVRQETCTDDMIWSVRQIVSHLSQGTTLRRGTAIMTGTPSGVGLFQKKFLKHGDVVEVEFDGLGSIKNTISFE